MHTHTRIAKRPILKATVPNNNMAREYTSVAHDSDTVTHSKQQRSEKHGGMRIASPQPSEATTVLEALTIRSTRKKRQRQNEHSTHKKVHDGADKDEP